MAKKTAVVIDDTPALELDKTLVVDGTTYNINAFQADKVANKLTIKKNLLTTVNEAEFDGSVAGVEIDYVPATGGKFAGNIRVPNNTDASFNKEAVLNYNDLKNSVLKELLNNSVLYEWTGEDLIRGGDGNSIKSISIVTGTAGDVNSFVKSNFVSKQFSAFIYVADDGSIFFGTSESDKVVPVSISADTANNANKLTTSRKIGVDLSSSSTANFDGSADITTGVNGTLPIAKGGTGATTAETARTNLGLASVAASGSYNDLADKPNYAGSSTPGGAATKALQDGNGNTITSYYQKKITISSSAPSGGANGDIWIKY